MFSHGRRILTLSNCFYTITHIGLICTIYHRWTTPSQNMVPSYFMNGMSNSPTQKPQVISLYHHGIQNPYIDVPSYLLLFFLFFINFVDVIYHIN